MSDLDTDKHTAMRLNTLHEKIYGSGIDYLFTAHMHHIEGCESLGIEHIETGCLCGADDYANKKRLFALPSQTMVFFERGIGRDAIYNFILDKKDRG